jgi:hypothetical protein
VKVLADVRLWEIFFFIMDMFIWRLYEDLTSCPPLGKILFCLFS